MQRGVELRRRQFIGPAGGEQQRGGGEQYDGRERIRRHGPHLLAHTRGAVVAPAPAAV